MLVHYLMYPHITIYIVILCNFVVLLVLFAASINLATSITVNFHQSKYIVNEKYQLLHPQVVLNESSSTNITVQIKSTDITATGKYINIIINDLLIFFIFLQEEVLIITLYCTMSHFLLE